MARDATLIGCGLAPGVLQVSKFSLCGGIHQLRRGRACKDPSSLPPFLFQCLAAAGCGGSAGGYLDMVIPGRGLVRACCELPSAHPQGRGSRALQRNTAAARTAVAAQQRN